MTGVQPLNVFISYSHKDEELKEELEVHLANLIRQNKINPWQDRALEAGTEWDAEIKAQLEAAHIILLLVTPRFMASGYINDIELQHAMDRHQQGTARVIPIILKPTDWTGTAFSKLQVLPKEAKPVVTWNNQDEALVNVVNGIRQAVDALVKSISATGLDSPSNLSPRALNHSPSSDSLPTITQAPEPAVSGHPLDTTVQQRLKLFQALSDLPGPTFDAIVYAVKAPPPLIPPGFAPQGQRTPALLNWAQSPVGCGLDKLEAVIDIVVKSNP